MKTLSLLLAACAVLSAFTAGFAQEAQGAAELKAYLSKMESGQKLQSSEIESLINTARTDTKNSLAHFVLGQYYESVNFGTLSAEQYEQAFDLDPKNSKAIVALARMKFRMGDEEASRKILIKAINLFPNDRDVLVTCGLFMQRHGDLKTAQACYQKALALAPPTAELMGAQAELLYQQSHYVDALKAAQLALKLNPNNILAKSVRGKCLFLAQEYKRAVPLLKDAYTAMPVNDDIAATYSNAALKAHDYEQALEPTLIAMAYAVKTPSKLIYYKRKVAGLITGLPPAIVEQQIQAAEKKTKGSQGGKFLYFCLGDVFDRLHRPADAIACFKKGLTIDSTYGRGYLRLGMDLEDYAGDHETALKCYENAFVLLPEDPEVKLRIARMKARYPQIKRDVAWQLKTNAKRSRSLKPTLQLG